MAWATAIIPTPHHFHCPTHPQIWVIKISFFTTGKLAKFRQAAGHQHQDVARLTGLGTLVIQSTETGGGRKGNRVSVLALLNIMTLSFKMTADTGTAQCWEKCWEYFSNLEHWSVGGEVTDQDNETEVQEGSHWPKPPLS